MKNKKKAKLRQQEHDIKIILKFFKKVNILC